MFSRNKKYFFIVVLIGLLLGSYWYIFGTQWGSAISEDHSWKYSFQPKEKTSFSTIKWNESNKIETIYKESKSLNLVFRTEFILEDYTTIIEGALEYDFRYSAKIFINGIECANVDRNLITPSLEGKKLKIKSYLNPRKVQLNQAFLSSHLKNGNNNITLIVYNLDDLNYFESSKKQLTFLTKGYGSRFKSIDETDEPTNYFSESKLPIFNINTDNTVIPDEPKISASLNIINNPSEINRITDAAKLHNIKIERRGHTSQSFSKKSYTLNVYDTNGKKTSIQLLGLPASKKWVLYGPYADKSLIRNALSYSLSNQMGKYAPRTQFISLVINNNYQGIYMLTEKIQISPEHVDIPLLKLDSSNPNEISGGYLIDIDRYLHLGSTNYPPSGDSSSHPVCYQVYQPKKINAAIKGQINTQFEIFQKHLYENDSIYTFVDVNSFVDYLLITELSKNIDGYRLSTFMYNKDINSQVPKFYLGPIWDYNFSFGLSSYHEGFQPEGYIYNADYFVPFWWNTLLTDSLFSNQLKMRYYELRKRTFSTININNTIDSLYDICEYDASNNFEKWPVLNLKDFWPNYYLGKTYEEEINYLKLWVKKRLNFLDHDILGKEIKGELFYEIIIRNDPKWMKEIILKAKNRKLSIDEMIKNDAKYMAKRSKLTAN